MAKRVRRFSISRNKQYETHQLDGQGQSIKVSEISDTDWKEKVKSETFEYLATEYGSLKSIALIFHDRDLTSDGERKGLHCHMILEFRNPVTITSLEKFKFEAGKSLNNQDLMFQSRNVEASKSSSGSYRYLTHTTDKAMMERKTRYEVQELIVAEYETDGSMKWITGEELELWYRDKIKGTVRPEKLEFDEALQETFYKVRQGELFGELEVEEFLRERFTEMQATELVIKNKKFFDGARQLYQQEVFDEMQSNGRNLKTFYISGLSGVGKSKFAKDLARRININNGKSPNFVYTAPTAKDGKTYDFIDSEYKAQDVTIFDDIDATSFGFQEFLNVFDKDNITKISSRYTNKAWVSHYAIITKASKIEDWMERLASQSSEYHKNERNQLVQVSRRIELWIDLDLENNQVNFYQFKHYPDDNKKSRWKKVARKEITLKEFHSESSAREEIFDIIFRITNPS
jgi:adenylate kinase family enzyme